MQDGVAALENILQLWIWP